MYDKRYVAKRREPEREQRSVIDENGIWLRKFRLLGVSVSGFRVMILRAPAAELNRLMFIF